MKQSFLKKSAAAGFILRFGDLGATARNKLHFDIGVKMPRLPRFRIIRYSLSKPHVGNPIIARNIALKVPKKTGRIAIYQESYLKGPSSITSTSAQ